MKLGLFYKLYNNIELLTIEAMDMMLYRPENTNIDRGEYIDQRIPILTEAKPRSILVFSGRYHIISTASIVNNCFIIYHSFTPCLYTPMV